MVHATQHLGVLFTLTVGLTAALVLGFITQRLKLSPILGYLIAGMLLGPATPGLVIDPDASHDFAEIGVILLMFGVGLHFKLEDLLAVRRVCVPGAIVTITTATCCGMAAAAAWGASWMTGLVIGIAISVASTVVLTRVLTDNDVLESEQGHIAFGWLIVEDLFTVFVLILLPSLASLADGSGDKSIWGIAKPVGLAVVRVGLLGLIVLGAGRHVIPWILGQVARTRTRELFTLTVLVLALAIATGSSLAFNVSMALGAFLAGMVVGQSEVSHQAAADALPMRDAFAVLFFVSVGTLFKASAVRENPGLFLALLSVILVAKPLAAMGIVWFLGYSPRAALTVAFGIAEIGEFSFIVADLGRRLDVLSDSHRSLIVACAIVTITVNPLMFRLLAPFERWLKKQPTLWRMLSRRSESRVITRGLETLVIDESERDRSRALIIGYGPVGRTAAAILKDFQIIPVIIDLNVDTVKALLAKGETAIYGDASHRDILRAAGIANAKYLLITIPDLSTRTLIVISARELNPDLRIFVRARYVAEQAWLEEIGVSEVVYEEAEAACGLGALLLREVGAGQEQIDEELVRIRKGFAMRCAE